MERITKVPLTKQYTYYADGLCMWITQTKKNGKGKETEVRVAGYSPNVHFLIRSFLDNKVRGVEATKVANLLKEINSSYEETVALINKMVDKIG